MEADSRYDVVVIGGGPAGYTAAIRAARLGLRTLCVDGRPSAGGTCLHVGCIPSKALLASSERLARARSELESHGISLGEPSFDLEALMRRKHEVVETLTNGVDRLLDEHGVDRLAGLARLRGERVVRVGVHGGNDRTVSGDRLVLATGSVPVRLPGVEVDGERIVDSTGALSFGRVPEHLAVVGGGYIGLELGSVWRRLGAEVTVIEACDRLLPEMDAELSEQAELALAGQGLRFRLSRAVERATVGRDGVSLRLRGAGDGDEEAPETLRCSHVLVAVGRRPATDGLDLEAAGVAVDDGGFVQTDARFRTTSPNVHAIGDVAGEPMLAHKGQLEALACVDTLTGRGSGYVHYDAIPAVVYTWPEIASVGRTEQELERAGIGHRTGRASFRHDSRALCTGEAEGFVKLLVEEGSGRLLGGHVFGPHAGSLVHELVVTLELGGSVEELGRSAHAHPTLNETLREAALDVYGRALHH